PATLPIPPNQTPTGVPHLRVLRVGPSLRVSVKTIQTEHQPILRLPAILNMMNFLTTNSSMSLANPRLAPVRQQFTVSVQVAPAALALSRSNPGSQLDIPCERPCPRNITPNPRALRNCRGVRDLLSCLFSPLATRHFLVCNYLCFQH